MATETRTVHLRLDPALAAYLLHIGQAGLKFDLDHYDWFAAGYRACCGDREPIGLSDE